MALLLKRKHLGLALPFIVVIVGFISACNLPPSFTFVKSRPDDGDLIGTWIVDRHATYNSSLGKLDGALLKARLELFDEHRFIATDLPINEIFSSTDGNLVVDSSSWSLHLGVYGEWQLRLNLTSGTAYDFDIMEKNGNGYVLVHALKQPDQPDRLVLVKQD